MKGSESNFLTHNQRVKYVGAIIPVITVLIVATIAFTATHKALVIGIGALIPILGMLLFQLSKQKSDQPLFKTLPVAINGLNVFLICWLAGPDSPSFLLGLAIIGVSTLIFDNTLQLIFAIIYSLLMVASGSFLAGKSTGEIAIYLVLLTCYSFVLVRMLHFTILQGKEIMTSHQKIETQKQLIEEKNKSITDSITYAKRIQQAKLPKEKEIHSSFPESFVLFKPKDIVSGDFYFLHKTNGLTFIAVADCTGHGVPGAFMSLIGSERLEDAVSQCTDTSEILKRLNRGMKSSLRQSDSEESTRDGMDLALCAVDTVNSIVNYAGANRPLWIVRKEQETLEEIKATRMAIGGLTKDEQNFESHELKLQVGDTFYMCTDGYADQFNGSSGKKLMTKKFKELLLAIRHKEMYEQKIYLDSFIENWKAGEEQVDDILVIGIRL